MTVASGPDTALPLTGVVKESGDETQAWETQGRARPGGNYKAKAGQGGSLGLKTKATPERLVKKKKHEIPRLVRKR